METHKLASQMKFNLLNTVANLPENQNVKLVNAKHRQTLPVPLDKPKKPKKNNR